MGITVKEAIGWLKMQSSKPVKWDDYSEENKRIREEAERRMKEAFNMAVEALKVQEPVEPKIVDTSNSKLYHNDMFKNHYCGNCGEFLHVVNRKDLFCSQCGRAVKWDG